ncbi:MAG: phage holin family protein [Armatimonadaceae bacterium]
MIRTIIRWVLAAIAMTIAVKVANTAGMNGVRIDNFGAALASIALLTLVNAVLRPIINALACAINMMTFGLFRLVVNGAMWLLVSQLDVGLHVKGLLDAIVASIALTILGWVLDLIVPAKSRGDE